MGYAFPCDYETVRRGELAEVTADVLARLEKRMEGTEKWIRGMLFTVIGGWITLMATILLVLLRLG